MSEASDDLGAARGGAGPGGPRLLLKRLPMLVWLWLLWALLWQSASAPVLLTGALLSVGITLAFPLPRVSPHVTMRPLRIAGLVLRVLADIVGSATAVAWAAVRYGRNVPTAVVEVPLRIDSDLLVTLTTLVANVSPGSLVLEIDRERLLLYVHVMPVHGPEAIESRRRKIQRIERSVVRALGPPEAVRAVEDRPR